MVNHELEILLRLILYSNCNFKVYRVALKSCDVRILYIFLNFEQFDQILNNIQTF